MQEAATKKDLLYVIVDEMKVFDLHDLEVMNARFERKVAGLPEDYRDRLLESVREEIFGGAPPAGPPLPERRWIRRPPPDPALGAYCAMVAEACTEKAREKDPKYLYLKYLLSGFTMFVMDEPAHPVGTPPFPGGRSSTSGRGPTSARSGIRPTTWLSLSAPPTARRSRARSRPSRRCGPAAMSGGGGRAWRTTGPTIRMNAI